MFSFGSQIFDFPFPIDPSELENPYFDYEDLEICS